MTITNAELRTLIPNVIHEVEGESLLIDKLAPWLASANKWLTDNFVGEDYSLPESLLPLTRKIIVFKAFADAVPSLDVTLSPAGFAVINTDGRAPASKERVERLIASLQSFVEANLPPFILSLLRREDWRDTSMGDYWLGTFMYGLDDAMANKRDKDLLTSYRSMRDSALRFETELSQDYLGKEVMKHLRLARYAMPSDDCTLVMCDLIRQAELRYIASHARDQKAKCPDDHEVWHLAQPILRELRYWPELRDMWEAEMGEEFAVKPFRNTVKGGFYF